MCSQWCDFRVFLGKHYRIGLNNEYSEREFVLVSTVPRNLLQTVTCYYVFSKDEYAHTIADVNIRFGAEVNRVSSQRRIIVRQNAPLGISVFSKKINNALVSLSSLLVQNNTPTIQLSPRGSENFS